MCLIIFAYNSHPDYKLIMAANRDEYYARPTKRAAWRGEILSGVDALAGGTWLGMTKTGRLAALTNYRNPAAHVHGKKTRGAVVADFLNGPVRSDKYSDLLHSTANDYNGYNLLYGDAGGLHWFSNRAEKTVTLKDGIYGLSNHLLETPWPKVVRGKKLLTDIISRDFGIHNLLNMLRDENRPPDEQLPETGVGLTVERALSPMFIRTHNYGTRSSTVILIDRDNNATFTEETYDSNGDDAIRTEEFALDCLRNK